MSTFRKPGTQNERKGDQAMRSEAETQDLKISGRLRTRSKETASLPTERSDLMPAANKDRSRGKSSHSPARKAKEKDREKLFKN